MADRDLTGAGVRQQSMGHKKQDTENYHLQ